MKTQESSVVAIVRSPAGRQVLLLKRRDVPIWVLPGGGVEEGETPESAAIREVLEETGLQVEIARLVACYTPINRLTKMTYLFECSPLRGELSTGDETQDLAFFPLDNMPSPHFFLHRDWIEVAEKNQEETLHAALTQVTYFNLLKYFCRHPLLVIRLMLSRLGIPYNSR